MEGDPTSVKTSSTQRKRQSYRTTKEKPHLRDTQMERAYKNTWNRRSEAFPWTVSVFQLQVQTQYRPQWVILWMDIHTERDRMRGYETAVLGHVYKLNYTQKFNASCYVDDSQKFKLQTKGKHEPTKRFPTACNARNFNSIKSSWPKCTPDAIQEQHRSLILALSERNVTPSFATHTQTDKNTQVETHTKPCEGRFGFSSC